MAGSTKKIKKQKGTGGARAGSMKSPVFVGGGRIFGPRPRSYRFKLNKKVKALARRSVLSQKAQTENVRVLEQFTFDKPSTRQYANMLKGLSMTDRKTLFVLPATDMNVVLSGRNLPKTRVVSVDSLNTYELLHADLLVFSEASIQRLSELLNK